MFALPSLMTATTILGSAHYQAGDEPVPLLEGVDGQGHECLRQVVMNPAVNSSLQTLKYIFSDGKIDHIS